MPQGISNCLKLVKPRLSSCCQRFACTSHHGCLMAYPINPFGGPRPKTLLAAYPDAGTNHGQWRVLVPVAPYGLFARVEQLYGLKSGTLRFKYRLVRSLLRGSEAWVASDWFESYDAAAWA